MSVEGWSYYHHAMVPTAAPHEAVNLQPVEDGTIWKSEKGRVLLARWTSDFDRVSESGWWYVILDHPFDICRLKSKRRYEINKGCENFDVRKICPSDYKEDLFQVTQANYQSYPEKYRPTVQRETFLPSVDNWTGNFYGGFHRETGRLCSYAKITINGNCANLVILRTDPAWEKLRINAAMVCQIVSDYGDFIRNGGYICDVSRSIAHETAFQDYLEKYFQFRKAYCKLHIRYSPAMKLAVSLLYPFRGQLRGLDENKLIHQINGILKMEEIVRQT